MKANEFIKIQGLAEAKRVLHDARGCVGVKIRGRYEFSTDDLKRLVESHELVESYMGLEMAKHTLSRKHYLDNNSMWKKLEQAILDVESCL